MIFITGANRGLGLECALQLEQNKF